MKKILYFLCFVLIGISLTACNNQTEDVESHELVEVDINSDVVIDAVEKADYLTDASIYSENKFTFDNYRYIYSALNVICKDMYGCNEIVSVNDINTVLKNEFIDPPELNAIDLREYEDSNMNGIEYEVVNDIIRIKSGRYWRTDVYFKTVKAEEDENYLYVYRKVYYLETTDVTSNSCACNLYATYNDMINGATPTQRIESSQSDNIKNCLPNSENNVIDWDRFNTYKLTFQKKDNNYYFISSELI